MSLSPIRSAGVLLLLELALVGPSSIAKAAWNSLTGIKDGSDHATEYSTLWTGPQLAAFGGILDFSGSAAVNGPVMLQEQNGWGDTNRVGILSWMFLAVLAAWRNVHAKQPRPHGSASYTFPSSDNWGSRLGT